MSVIKIESLVRDYGDGKGVFHVSFHVNQGEAFGFLGPNGAGKTTTIRHLMGFLKPKSGSKSKVSVVYSGVCGWLCGQTTTRPSGLSW